MKYANRAIALAVAAALSASANGAAVDVSDFSGLAAVTLNSSAGTGTTPTSAVKLQESDDGSTGWTDVAGGAFAAQSAAASLQTIFVNTDSLKKFVRVVNTLGGTTPGYVFGVTMVGNRQSV